MTTRSAAPRKDTLRSASSNVGSLCHCLFSNSPTHLMVETGSFYTASFQLCSGNAHSFLLRWLHNLCAGQRQKVLFCTVPARTRAHSTPPHDTAQKPPNTPCQMEKEISFVRRSAFLLSHDACQTHRYTAYLQRQTPPLCTKSSRKNQPTSGEAEWGWGWAHYKNTPAQFFFLRGRSRYKLGREARTTRQSPQKHEHATCLANVCATLLLPFRRCETFSTTLRDERRCSEWPPFQRGVNVPR